MPALLLGSIGVLAETSHLQRAAFNRAFAEAGLDWHWSEDAYIDMLQKSGGQARIETYAAQRGDTVDAAALHARKNALFRAALGSRGGVPLRPGVSEALAGARAPGWTCALVTTTSPEIVTAVLRATCLGTHHFNFILDGNSCTRGKPDPQCYRHALKRLGISATSALAIEDTPDGARAAVAAGISTIAFPGACHAEAEFKGVIRVVDDLRPCQALAA